MFVADKNSTYTYILTNRIQRYFVKRSGFTIIELIFVIVVLGILSAIALPKFIGSQKNAVIARGKSDVSAIRAAIMNERQKRLVLGQVGFITKLDGGAAEDTAEETIFDNNGSASNGLLTYGITTSDSSGHWMKTGNNEYTYKISDDTSCTFKYTPANGKFVLDDASDDIDECNKLVQ